MKKIYIIPALIITILIASCSVQQQPTKNYRGLFKSGQSTYLFDTASYESQARRYLIKGSVYQQQHKWAESIIEFQQALRHAEEAAIYYAMGRSYKEINKYQLALECIEKSIELDSAFIPAVELLTDLYIIKSQLPDAIRAYSYLAELEPTYQRRYSLARLYELDNDYEESAGIFTELLRERPQDIDLNMRLVDTYSKLGNDSMRIYYLEEVHRLDNDNSHYTTELLEAYLHSQKYDKLSSLFDNMDSVFTSAQLVHFYAATAAWMIEDSSQAARESTSGFLDRIDNRFYFEWRINLFSMYLADKISDSTRVRHFAEQSMKAPDSIPDISIQVAMFYLQREQYDETLDVVDRNEPVFPDNYNYPLIRSFVYTSTDRDLESLEELYRANALDTNNLQIIAQFGIVYDKLGMIDSSLIAYRKALSIDPGNALVNNNYAYSLAKAERDLDRAEIMSMKALEREPNNPSYLDTYGWIQYLLGNYELALEYIRKAIENGDSSGEVYVHLGEIFLELGKNPEAKQAFAKALQINPDDNNIKLRLQQLNE